MSEPALESSGLTGSEQNVMDDLIDAFYAYLELPVEHEDEPGEFRFHIHMLQGLLACRIVRREFPEGWPHVPR
jgi:hypothetical protein